MSVKFLDLSSGEREWARESNFSQLQRIWFPTALILVPALLLALGGWQSSSQFHTLLEGMATLLALVIGVLALVRFYARKSNLFLFVGTGFIATGLLDGYHALATSSAFISYFPSLPPSLIPWSWLASRTMLSSFMYLGRLARKREAEQGESGRIAERLIYVGACSLTGIFFLFFAFAPLPAAYYAEWFVHRPEELIPGALLLLALWGYGRKGLWRSDVFEYWLVLSLLVGLACQICFMAFSSQLFDGFFAVAHLLKIVSYILVFVGLVGSTYNLFKQAEDKSNEIARGKEELEREMVGRLRAQDKLQTLNDDLEQRVEERTRDLDMARLAALNMMADAEKARHQAEQSKAEVTRYRDHLEELVDERTAALKTVNAELEVFSYSVSHDLRSPLRSIDGFSRALLEDHEEQLDAEGKDYLHRVCAASQRMGKLIDDLLSLSRLTRGELTLRTIDMSALAGAIEAELRAGSPEREAEVVIEEGLVAKADPRLIRALMDNLLGNAWKFTGQKDGARIEFGAAEVEGECAFFVRDNGAGFDMAYADKLFGAFQRLHRAEEYAGTGIGLAIVQRIVHRHGGRLWAEGEVGRGATFYFSFENRGTA